MSAFQVKPINLLDSKGWSNKPPHRVAWENRNVCICLAVQEGRDLKAKWQLCLVSQEALGNDGYSLPGSIIHPGFTGHPSWAGVCAQVIPLLQHPSCPMRSQSRWPHLISASAVTLFPKTTRYMYDATD